MGRRHELKRVEADRRLDQLLESEEGRGRYWADLLEACKRDPMIALLESSWNFQGT